MYNRINYALVSEPIKKVFDETTLMSFNRLCVDTVNNQVEGKTQQQANAEILSKMREVMGLSENPNIVDVQRALGRTANREAMFEVIEEVVDQTLITGWQSSPYFNQFVDYRSLALGDTNVFYVEDQTPLVVSEVAASNHDITRQRVGAGTEYSVTVRNYSAKIYMEAERYLMGQESFTALINKIATAYTQRVNTLIHDAFIAAAGNLPNASQWSITMALSTENYQKFVKLCSDVAIATGIQPIIMGTSVALSGLQNMYKTDIFAEAAKADVYNFGRVGHFNQYQVAEIPQAFKLNDTTKYLYDDEKLLIMPSNQKFVKMFDEGNTQIYQVTDRDKHADHSFDYEVSRKMGVGVVTASRFGMVSILES